MWDTGLPVKSYAASMRTGSQCECACVHVPRRPSAAREALIRARARVATLAGGGAIEMAVCAKLRNVHVHVYEGSGARFKRISRFESDNAPGGGGGKPRRTVNVVYGGRVHYDALVISE